ncbi:hypothetical protein [Gaopeijia maritima]|uniref:Uncharacterized protein n=1 Tax=Gaopeijia maritima TaxID=3119007 RepID=A0ABU9E914_9BACT
MILPTSPARPGPEWHLDGAESEIRIRRSDGAFRVIDLRRATGRVRWVEGGEGSMSVSLRWAGSAETAADPGDGVAGGFDGAAEAPRAGGTLLLRGVARWGDALLHLDVLAVPTTFRMLAGTECLDVEFEGALPANDCGASRVEGVLRIVRRAPAA